MKRPGAVPLAACALAGLVVGAAAQQPTFRAGVEAVRVDVLVTDGGRPIPGLRAEDFELRDAGVPQRVDLVDAVQLPLNVVLVFDLSASVAGEPLSHLQAAGRAVLEGLRPEDRVALVGFSHDVQLFSGLTGDHDAVAAALARAEPGGNTAWLDAALAGLLVTESEAGRSLVLVFTDGIDTSSWLTPDALIGLARRTGVVVYGVTSTSRRKPVELSGLADATGGRLIEVETAKVLRGTFLQILEEFRHRYVLAFSPQGVPRTGWHALQVRLRSRRGTVTARPGYYAEGR